jgi:hypothetical protein
MITRTNIASASRPQLPVAAMFWRAMANNGRRTNAGGYLASVNLKGGKANIHGTEVSG